MWKHANIILLQILITTNVDCVLLYLWIIKQSQRFTGHVHSPVIATAEVFSLTHIQHVHLEGRGSFPKNCKSLTKQKTHLK